MLETVDDNKIRMGDSKEKNIWKEKEGERKSKE